MRLNKREKEVLQRNKDILLGVLNRRIEELKNSIVFQQEGRDRKADLVVEIEYLKHDLGLVGIPKEIKKENYI